MKKMLLTAVALSTAMLLCAADLKTAVKQIRSAKDEKALNAVMTETLKTAQTDDAKGSLMIEAGDRAVALKLYAPAVKFYAGAAALPKVSDKSQALAMSKQAWVMRTHLNQKKEAVELLKKLKAMNVPGWDYSVNCAIADTIYYGGKGFKRSEAIPYYEAILKYPNNSGMFFVVRDRIEKKKLAEAREVLEKAKKQPNPNKNFRYDLTNAEGELLCAEGKYDASIATYSKLDKINPGRHYTHVLYQYQVYRAAKNKAKAVEMLKELLKSGWKTYAQNELKYWEKVK